MALNRNNEYYVVKGWFESSNGLHNGKFYGAVATPSDYLKPIRIVLDGRDATAASQLASRQPAKVYPQEISEAYDRGGLTPVQRADSERMLLDQEGKHWQCQKCRHELKAPEAKMM